MSYRMDFTGRKNTLGIYRFYRLSTIRPRGVMSYELRIVHNAQDSCPETPKSCAKCTKSWVEGSVLKGRWIQFMVVVCSL